MTNETKLMAGILLITVPSIEYGGTFLLSVLSGKQPALTDFQRSMFRAGHAHAGVLVILALVTLLFIDQANFGPSIAWALRIGFGGAPILVSAGFFFAALGGGRTRPSELIALVWAGALVLATSVLTLGVGLIRTRG